MRDVQHPFYGIQNLFYEEFKKKVKQGVQDYAKIVKEIKNFANFLVDSVRNYYQIDEIC